MVRTDMSNVLGLRQSTTLASRTALKFCRDMLGTLAAKVNQWDSFTVILAQLACTWSQMCRSAVLCTLRTVHLVSERQGPTCRRTGIIKLNPTCLPFLRWWRTGPSFVLYLCVCICGADHQTAAYSCSKIYKILQVCASMTCIDLLHVCVEGWDRTHSKGRASKQSGMCLPKCWATQVSLTVLRVQE